MTLVSCRGRPWSRFSSAAYFALLRTIGPLCLFRFTDSSSFVASDNLSSIEISHLTGETRRPSIRTKDKVAKPMYLKVSTNCALCVLIRTAFRFRFAHRPDGQAIERLTYHLTMSTAQLSNETVSLVTYITKAASPNLEIILAIHRSCSRLYK